MTRYNKFLVALVPVVLATLEVLRNALSDDDSLSVQEIVSVLVAAVTAVGVYLVPNKAPAGELPDPNQSEVGPYSPRHTDIGAVSPTLIWVLAVVGIVAIVLFVLGRA